MRALARAGAFCRASGPDFGTLMSVFPCCVDVSFWWGGKSVSDDEGPGATEESLPTPSR